jgi:hypothetical protein
VMVLAHCRRCHCLVYVVFCGWPLWFAFVRSCFFIRYCFDSSSNSSCVCPLSGKIISEIRGCVRRLSSSFLSVDGGLGDHKKNNRQTFHRLARLRYCHRVR